MYSNYSNMDSPFYPLLLEPCSLHQDTAQDRSNNPKKTFFGTKQQYDEMKEQAYRLVPALKQFDKDIHREYSNYSPEVRAQIGWQQVDGNPGQWVRLWVSEKAKGVDTIKFLLEVAARKAMAILATRSIFE